MDHQRSCWVVSDGGAGMENQCLGLAEALGYDPVIKRVHLHSPWRQLGPHFRLGSRFAASPKGDAITPPWPDLLIASGRQSVIPSLVARRLSRGRTMTVQIQDPAISAQKFDLVIVPQHDRLRGPNVLVTQGALHRVTPRRLADAADKHGPRLATLPKPRVAVLVGGTNAVYRITPTVMGDFGERLARMAQASGAGLMVTASRRTGADNAAILRAWLKGLPADMWDGTGDNPYFAYLALADAIIVTADSVSMSSEACSTGKPVYVAALEGGSPKFERFHQGLRTRGATRPFDGVLESWTYEPLSDVAAAAIEVRRRFSIKHGGSAITGSTTVATS